MRHTSQTFRLSDYRAPDYRIRETRLHFTLDPQETLVKASLTLVPNSETNPDAKAPLVLNGRDLYLQKIAINQSPLAAGEYQTDESSLTIPTIPLHGADSFELETIVRISPGKNTSLEGLYISNGMFCTQCEAEGFRRITYFLDRPDVLSRFTVTLEADSKQYPVLLSNGNLVASSRLDDRRHTATWEDPFPKPCYLFALVAGDLVYKEDTYTTRLGNPVTLRIYVEEKDLDKIDHAMASLKQAFAWDEKTYNRIYDLDIFHIVAVSHFNMGAMENKSLNIFNTSCVLANQQTATDAAHDRVRDVIAHEYFHNWSGNRVTCRDWHQLSLKEGFTVYRDATFNADHGSPVVKRIEDATQLRTFQFKEDAGPTAHAVLPKEVRSFDNFYTLTIYEKGAEIIGMYRTLLGDHLFFQGTDLYFDRHDGQAVTIEDFSKAMEDASGMDLSQFRRWYHQAGTPHVDLQGTYDPDTKTFTLQATQSCRSTPETSKKKPFVIPIRIGLLDPEGKDMPLSIAPGGVITLTQSRQTFRFENIPHPPVPSLFRHFSAPVTYQYPYTQEALLFLMQHDTDGFNRWDACQQIAEATLLNMLKDPQAAVCPSFVDACRNLLTQTDLDPAMVAEMLRLPSETLLSQKVDRIDPDTIHSCREAARRTIAVQLETVLKETYDRLNRRTPYDLSITGRARRALKNVCLSYLCQTGNPKYYHLTRHQYDTADNMTEKQAAFINLAHCEDQAIREAILADFYTTYQEDKLLINIWFQAQATAPLPGTLKQVRTLLKHPAFDPKSPNDIRSLVGAFASNAIHFHDPSGSGYRFLCDHILQLNQTNPQIAARLVTPFAQWKRYDLNRRQHMQAALETIQSCTTLSTNVKEQVDRCLA